MSSDGEIIRNQIRKTLREEGYKGTDDEVNIIYYSHLNDPTDSSYRRLIGRNSLELKKLIL